MKINLNVTLQDGTRHKVEAADADIIALEEQFDIDASILSTRQRLLWLAFLAWSSMSRKGLTTDKWEDWKTKSFGEIDMSEAASGNE